MRSSDSKLLTMKLSDIQKSEVLHLLSYLSEHDLLSLARTITNNLVPFRSQKDAEEAIILHEIDLQTFLTRRKMTREILFKYLYNKKIDIPANSDKSHLINKLIEILEQQPPTHQIQSASCQIQNTSQDGINVGDVDTLAEKFAEWFYSILNEYITCQRSDNLCIDHFWNDCSLHLVMESSLESVVKDVQKNSESVVSALRELQMQHRLYFNPNISRSGVRGKVDNHGLVLVMACGTLHQVDKCVGIFQQMFGLVRDPFMQNNWRIKSTSILLRNEETSKLPLLEEECFSRLPLLL